MATKKTSKKRTKTETTTTATPAAPSVERARNISTMEGVFIAHNDTALFDCQYCGAKDVNMSHFDTTKCALQYWCERNTKELVSQGYVRLDAPDLDERFKTDLLPEQPYADDKAMVYATTDFKIDPDTKQHEAHYVLWLRPDWAEYMVEVARVYGRDNSEEMINHHKKWFAATDADRSQMLMQISLVDSQI